MRTVHFLRSHQFLIVAKYFRRKAQSLFHSKGIDGKSFLTCLQILRMVDRRRVQNDLLDLGADLCVPGEAGDKLRITAAYVDRLEAWLDEVNEGLEALDSFVLPGGKPSAAWLHLARTVCRRGERRVSELMELEPDQVNPLVLHRRHHYIIKPVIKLSKIRVFFTHFFQVSEGAWNILQITRLAIAQVQAREDANTFDMSL